MGMRRYRKLLFLLVALCLVGLFLYKFKDSIDIGGFHWATVSESLRQARVSLLILGVVVTYCCFALRSLRWIRFSRSLGGLKFWDVFSATVSGFACVFLLGRAGEPVRPVLISRKSGISMPAMFGVYVLERIADIAAAGTIAVLALMFFGRNGQAVGLGDKGAAIMAHAQSASVVLLTGLVGVIAFLVYFRFHGGHWLAAHLKESRWRHGWRGKVILLLEGFSEGLQGIHSWQDLLVLTGYTAIHWALIAVIYLWVAHAFPGRLSTISLASMLLVLAFGLIGSTMQVPGVGGGSQGATFLVFTFVLGVDPGSAFVASMMLWLVTFVSSALLGLPLLFREGWSVGELQRMAQAEEKRGEEELLVEAEEPVGQEKLP
jgi:glycosyltransferase 2 family protein